MRLFIDSTKEITYRTIVKSCSKKFNLNWFRLKTFELTNLHHVTANRAHRHQLNLNYQCTIGSVYYYFIYYLILTTVIALKTGNTAERVKIN